MAWKVRGRHPDGRVSSILCDPEHVRDILNELRARRYSEVWVEDAEGRMVDEPLLTGKASEVSARPGFARRAARPSQPQL
jgi:hypothetical protein